MIHHLPTPTPIQIPPPRASLASAQQDLRESLRGHVAALGWLDFDAASGAMHASLPADVFIVTLQLGDTPEAFAQLGDTLHIFITPLREQARHYRVAGRSQMAVATLTVGGMLALFSGDWLALADRPVPLAQVCSATRVRQLQRALQACHGLDACTAAFGRWLEDGLLDSGPLALADARVARSALRISAIESAHFDVQTLAAQEGVTRRQLERDFRRRLGISPGGLARVVRFQRAAAAISSGMALADSAVEYGYADQAHMNRAFKTYSAMTPRAVAVQGARPGRAQLRAGLAGRVVLLDLPTAEAAAVAMRAVPNAAPPAPPAADWQRQVMARWAA